MTALVFHSAMVPAVLCAGIICGALAMASDCA